MVDYTKPLRWVGESPLGTPPVFLCEHKGVTFLRHGSMAAAYNFNGLCVSGKWPDVENVPPEPRVTYKAVAEARGPTTSAEYDSLTRLRDLGFTHALKITRYDDGAFTLELVTC